MKIEYVFVGGIAVIAFGRIRTTSDIDVIVNHKAIDFEKFVNLLQNNGFDASITDMKNFSDQLHVNFYDKDTMFRIDMKGMYADKDKESIVESVLVEVDNVKIRLDSFENIIVNKLLFGSQIDLEDAMAILTKNFDQIDFNIVQKKAMKLGVFDELKELIDLYESKSAN